MRTMIRRINIGKKLTLGFAAIILLMAVSAVIAYLKQRELNAIVTELQQQISPTIRSADRMKSALHRSLSALRAYRLRGDNPMQAERFKSERKSAWDELDQSFAKLEIFAEQWKSSDDLGSLKLITDNIEALRAAQKEVEDIAHTTANIPANQLLFEQAAPVARRTTTALNALIELEARQTASAERRDLLKALADNQGSFALCLANVRAFVLSGDVTFREQFEENWAINERSFREATGLSQLLLGAQAEEWKTYVSQREEFGPLRKKMFDLRSAADWNRADSIVDEKALPLGQRLLTGLTQLQESREKRLREAGREAESATAALTATLFGSTLIAAFVGMAIAAFTSRKITKSVSSVVERAKQISAGDLTGEPIREISRDEVGELAEVFNEMQNSLRDQIGQTRSGLENLNSASAQILAAAQQQAAATRQQASSVQEVNSTMQELSKSGAEISERARNVADVAQDSVSTSSSGIATVQKTTRLMDSIREQVEEVAKKIVALSEKTQAVGEITSAVNDVAEQSKLLSLNASIEAASANGEGNRFSVVASEMKNLADQAKESTAQVRNLLGDIQKGINTAVMLTEESVKRVEAGKQQADATQETISTLAETTEQSVQAFQQVIAGSNQQQIGFDQITKGMQDIHQATEQTATSTQQLEGAVANLNTLGRQLSGVVEKYKV